MLNRRTYMGSIWDFLGSRNLSVFIFVMGITYSLILVIFSLVVPAWWVGNIASLLPFKIFFIIFFINLLICEIKWIPVIINKCRKPKAPETFEELQRFKHRIDIQDLRFKIQDLKRYLRRRGYKIQGPGVRGQGAEENISRLTSHVTPILYAYKGRFSSLGNLLFHMAFFFILAGGWLGLMYRFEGSSIIMEGNNFMGAASEYTTLSRGGPIPSISFRVDRIEPSYWENKLLFTDLKADVVYPEKGEISSGAVRLAQPLRIDGSMVTLTGMGIAPKYVLAEREGAVLDSGFVKLNIFPPGNEDVLMIEGYPYKILVSFYPDYEDREGVPSTRSMNPVDPAYFVKVFRNRIPSYTGVLKAGEEAQFEGLRLSFPEFKYWGMFRIVKNPGFLFIWVAFILFGIGLLLRLMYYRREIVVSSESTGIYLYGNSDYYHNLFLNILSEKIKP